MIRPGSFPRRGNVPASALHVARLVRQLRAPEDALRDQTVRLAATLSSAYRSSEFYARRWDAVPGVADFASLPVVMKADLLSAPETSLLTGPVPAGARRVRTSGTAGAPLTVYYPPDGAWWQGLLVARAMIARGIRPWNARVGSVGWQRDTRTNLVARIRRRRWRSYMDEPLSEIVRELRAFRPTVLTGPGHRLIELAEAARGALRPTMVTTGGETLTSAMRTELRDAYGVEPLDTYGANEAGQIAWQCAAADLYHVNHESLVVEILDDELRPVPDGTTGNVVLTVLWNELQPLVRYRIADAAAFATRPCACGRPGRALAPPEGRILDWFVDHDGRRVPPQYFYLARLVDRSIFENVRRYRVRQDAHGAVLAELVAKRPFEPSAVEAIRLAIERLVGARTPVTVRIVDAIPTEPSGKLVSLRSARTPGSTIP